MINTTQIQKMSHEVMEQIHANMENSVCWLMDEALVMPMYWANMTTAISYFIIPSCIFTVLFFFRKLLTPIQKCFLWFCVLFIASCGYGHIVKVYNFWWGNFELELMVDRVTAVVSSITALSALYGSFLMLRAYRKSRHAFMASMKSVLVAIGALKVVSDLNQTIKAPKLIDLFPNTGLNNTSKEINFIKYSKLDQTPHNTPFYSDTSEVIQNTRINKEMPGFTATSVMRPNSYVKRHGHDTQKILKCTKGAFYDSYTNKWYREGEFLFIDVYDEQYPDENWHDIETGNEETDLLTFIMPKS